MCVLTNCSNGKVIKDIKGDINAASIVNFVKRFHKPAVHTFQNEEDLEQHIADMLATNSSVIAGFFSSAQQPGTHIDDWNSTS